MCGALCWAPDRQVVHIARKPCTHAGTNTLKHCDTHMPEGKTNDDTAMYGGCYSLLHHTCQLRGANSTTITDEISCCSIAKQLTTKG